MQEEIKESFLLEHKIVPENSHFLSRTYDGEISTSDVCKKIYELVINLIPEIYGLRNKNNFELEQYYLENEISIKGVLQLSNKDEFIDVARKIGKLESLEFIDSRYDFDKYAKDELLTEVDLEIEFAKNKIVFKMYLNNKIIQNENNITFRFVQ